MRRQEGARKSGGLLVTKRLRYRRNPVRGNRQKGGETARTHRHHSLSDMELGRRPAPTLTILPAHSYPKTCDVPGYRPNAIRTSLKPRPVA